MIRQESLSILGGSITSELWHQSQEAPEDLIILRQGESVPMTLFMQRRKAVWRRDFLQIGIKGKRISSLAKLEIFWNNQKQIQADLLNTNFSIKYRPTKWLKEKEPGVYHILPASLSSNNVIHSLLCSISFPCIDFVHFSIYIVFEIFIFQSSHKQLFTRREFNGFLFSLLLILVYSFIFFSQQKIPFKDNEPD